MKILSFVLGCFLLSGCTQLFYFPSDKVYHDPKALKLVYSDVTFKASDGVQLHGLHFTTKRKKPKGLIVFFHGNAENVSSHFSQLYWLVAKGYDFFLFDYRGFGKSKGEVNHSLIQMDNHLALKKALDLANRRQITSLILYGQSLGGILAAKAFSTYPDFEKLQSRLKLLVLDSTFISYQDMATDKLQEKVWTWPFSWLGMLLISDEYSLVKTDFHQLASVKTLVIHGEQDGIVPIKNGKLLFDSIPKGKNHKEFWSIKNGKHIDIFTRLNYRQKFLHFLEN